MITLLNKFDDNYIIKKEDVLNISSAYISENNVEEYLSDICFDSTINNIAQYNLKNNIIYFNDDKIIQNAYRLFDVIQSEFEIDENHYTYYLNYYYLFIIYHELTHVSQKARYERSVDDVLFKYLYKMCSLLRQGDVTFYSKKHDYFPMEKEANNKGYLRAYNLMAYTKLPGKECKIMYLKYLNSLLSNYRKTSSKIISPVELLLGKDDECIIQINKLLDKEKLSKIDRLNFGVSITPKEYDSLNKERSKILLKK